MVRTPAADLVPPSTRRPVFSSGAASVTRPGGLRRIPLLTDVLGPAGRPKGTTSSSPPANTLWSGGTTRRANRGETHGADPLCRVLRAQRNNGCTGSGRSSANAPASTWNHEIGFAPGGISGEGCGPRACSRRM